MPPDWVGSIPGAWGPQGTGHCCCPWAPARGTTDKLRAGCPKAIGENPSFPSSNPCWSSQLTADARAGPTAPNHPSAEFAPNARFRTAPASFPLLSSSVGNKTAEGRVLLCTAWAPVPEHLCRGETEEAQGSDKSLSQGSPKGPGTDHKPANPHSIAAGRSDGKGWLPDDSQCSQGQPQSLRSLSAVSSAALPPPCHSLHSACKALMVAGT